MASLDALVPVGRVTGNLKAILGGDQTVTPDPAGMGLVAEWNSYRTGAGASDYGTSTDTLPTDLAIYDGDQIPKPVAPATLATNFVRVWVDEAQPYEPQEIGGPTVWTYTAFVDVSKEVVADTAAHIQTATRTIEGLADVVRYLLDANQTYNGFEFIIITGIDFRAHPDIEGAGHRSALFTLSIAA